MEYLWFFLMNVMKQKYPFCNHRDHPVKITSIDPGGSAFQSIQQPRFVLIRLEFPHHPGAGVGERFVIKIDRVLSRQYQPHTKGTCLFQHPQNNALAGWVRDRGEITSNFIKVNHNPQAPGPFLGSHPGLNSCIKQRHKEHPLLVAQVREVEDAVARFSVRRKKDCADIKWSTLKPGVKCWCGKEVIQQHRQLKTFILGIELVKRKYTKLIKGR